MIELVKQDASQPGHEYTVELRFYGDGVKPLEISHHLNLRANEILTGVRRAQSVPVWGYSGQDKAGYQAEWSSLEEGFEYLLGCLAPAKTSILELSRRFDSVWWCGHFQSNFSGGPTLSPHLLHQLASYQIPLFIDNYFAE